MKGGVVAGQVVVQARLEIFLLARQAEGLADGVDGQGGLPESGVVGLLDYLPTFIEDVGNRALA